MTPFKQAVIDYVKQIPFGKLDYYGRVSERVGGTAQTVGYIMSGLTVDECETIPWQRVVNKQGYISTLKLGIKGELQKMLLRDEGHEIIDDFVDIKNNLW